MGSLQPASVPPAGCRGVYPFIDAVATGPYLQSKISRDEPMANLSGLELRSKVTSDGKLELSLEEAVVPVPAADEVVVRVEASPINPSDLGMLLGPADASTFTAGGTAERPI